MAKLIAATLLSVLCLLIIGDTSAQQDATEDECSVSLREQYVESAEVCAGLAPGEICYANGDVTFTIDDDSQSLANPGDVGIISGVRQLDYADNFGDNPGLVSLRPRANMDVGALSMVAVGDVTLRNESDANADIIVMDAIIDDNVGGFLRLAPNATADVITPLNWGQTFNVSGRTADSAWLLARVDDTFGWVSTVSAGIFGDIAALYVVENPNSPPLVAYGAFQSFSLMTGDVESACPEYPVSGLLVQTPDSDVTGYIVVNTLPIRFTGTIFLRTAIVEDRPEMTVSILEGTATLAEDIEVNAADLARFTLDARGHVVDFDDNLANYDYLRARQLPLNLLARQIELPFSASGDWLMPFAPGTGFFVERSPDDPCVVAWTVPVNLRVGPGVDFALGATADVNLYTEPEARAVGTDGEVWWRLRQGIWVQANNTVFSSNCSQLPFVTFTP